MLNKESLPMKSLKLKLTIKHIENCLLHHKGIFMFLLRKLVIFKKMNYWMLLISLRNKGILRTLLKWAYMNWDSMKKVFWIYMNQLIFRSLKNFYTISLIMAIIISLTLDFHHLNMIQYLITHLHSKKKRLS